MAGLLKRFRQSYFLYSFLRDPVAVTSFALFVVLALAAGVFLIVAVSSGHLSVRHRRIERIARQADLHLNAKGQVPQFLRRLDER